MWRCMPVVPALRRVRQESHQEFETSLSCKARLSLNKKKKRKRKIQTVIASEYGWHWLGRNRRKLFKVIKLFYILIAVWVTEVYAFVKIHGMVHLKFIHFGVHIFELKEKRNIVVYTFKGKCSCLRILCWNISKE